MTNIDILYIGGSNAVLAIVIGNEPSNLSSNPGQGYLHCTNTFGKVMHLTILPPAMRK